jgi:hypothetical protein
MIALAIILALVGVHNLMNSKAGRQLVSGFKSAFQGGREALACETKMTDVYAAITRYRSKNGKYPAKLSVLTPDYLPDSTVCHCSLDSNPSPTHPTFTYSPPTSSSKPLDKVLSFTWTEKITILQQTESVQTVYFYDVAGTAMIQQTTTDSNGRIITNPPTKLGASPS